MVWDFIGFYIIFRTLHCRLEIRNFSSRVEKIFHSLAHSRSLVKYFSTLEEKFRISARPCNILYVFFKRVPRCLLLFELKHTKFIWSGAFSSKCNRILFSKERRGAYVCPACFKGGVLSGIYRLESICRFYYISGQFVLHLSALVTTY